MNNQIILGWLWLLRIATGGTVLYRFLIWMDFLVDAESSLVDSLWGIWNFNFFWQFPLLLVYGLSLAGFRYFLLFNVSPADRYLMTGLLILQGIDVVVFFL